VTTSYTRYQQLLDESKERFARDTADHKMTVLHEDGLYRHLRFRADGSLVGFDLITWPGSLTIQGGHGTYTFRRETDMFGFFRASNGVNVDYWAEKLPGGRDSVKVYEVAAVVRPLVEAYREHGRRLPQLEAEYELAAATHDATPWQQRWPYAVKGPRPVVKPPAVAELRQQLRDAYEDGDLEDEDGARRLLNAWESVGVVWSAFEWDLREYDFHFVWSCHAIRWGIRRYDEAKAAAVQAGKLAGATQ
jgi:hypothetical protein